MTAKHCVHVVLILMGLCLIPEARAGSQLVLVGSCANAAGNSCTPTTVGGHSFAAGDFVYEFAMRTATTAPTLGAGFTALDTASASSSSFRSGCQVMTTATPPAVSWTNATRVLVLIYSGSNADTTANCVTQGIGQRTSAGTSGTTSTYTFTGFTNLNEANGTSFIIAAVGSSAAVCTPSTVLTSQISDTDLNGMDSNGSVTSFSTKTCTGTTGNWKSDTVELLSACSPTGLVTQCRYCQGSAATLACLFLQNVTSGHLLIALCGTGGTGAPCTAATDSLTSTWANATSNTTSGAMRIDYAKSAASTGADTVTCHVTLSDDIHCTIYELSGMDASAPLDQIGNTNGSASDQTVPTASNTAVNNEFILAGFYDNANGQPAYSEGTGYSNGMASSHGSGASGDAMFSEESQSNTAGAQTAHATRGLGSAAYGAIIASFKQATSSFQPDEDFWKQPPLFFQEPTITVWGIGAPILAFLRGTGQFAMYAMIMLAMFSLLAANWEATKTFARKLKIKSKKANTATLDNEIYEKIKNAQEEKQKAELIVKRRLR